MPNIYLVFLGVLIIGLFIAGTSYSNLIKTYNKYNTRAYVNITAGQFVATAFRYLNLPQHRILIGEKPLSDAYLVNKKVVVVSRQNFESKTISAIAVAAHEIGHVMQHKSGSKLFAISYLLQKFSRLADFLLLPSLIVGGSLILFSEQYLSLGNSIFLLGVGLYILTLMFKIITIPLEMNASKRALYLLKTERILDADELKGAKKVLRAAALTYVGSLFYNLLRFLKGVSRSFD
jgi:uncharacterized protein